MSRLFLFGELVCSCPSAALLGSRLRRQRSRAQERGLSRGNLSPLTVFC